MGCTAARKQCLDPPEATLLPYLSHCLAAQLIDPMSSVPIILLLDFVGRFVYPLIDKETTVPDDKVLGQKLFIGFPSAVATGFSKLATASMAREREPPDALAQSSLGS